MLVVIEGKVSYDEAGMQQMLMPVGPFDSPEEAVAFIEANAPLWGTWELAELHAPVLPRPDPGRRVPVQSSRDDANQLLPAGTISWAEHVEAWHAYHREHPNTQTAEVLAKRGGFGRLELLLYLGHAPTTFEEKR